MAALPSPQGCVLCWVEYVFSVSHFPRAGGSLSLFLASDFKGSVKGFHFSVSYLFRTWSIIVPRCLWPLVHPKKPCTAQQEMGLCFRKPRRDQSRGGRGLWGQGRLQTSLAVARRLPHSPPGCVGPAISFPHLRKHQVFPKAALHTPAVLQGSLVARVRGQGLEPEASLHSIPGQAASPLSC